MIEKYQKNHLFKSCARIEPSSEEDKIAFPFWVKQISVTPASCSVKVTIQNEVVQFHSFTWNFFKLNAFKYNKNLENKIYRWVIQ